MNHDDKADVSERCGGPLTADLRSVFRELTEALAHGDTIQGFSLVSQSMESPKGEDNINLTRLLAVPAFRDDRANLVSRVLLAIQENLEAGGHRHLAESAEDVLMVNIGGYE